MQKKQNNSGSLAMEESKVAKRALPRFTRFAVVVCIMGITSSVMLIAIYHRHTVFPLFQSPPAKGSSNDSFRLSNSSIPMKLPDMLIDTTKFDQKSCTSRYVSHYYRKPSTRDPSPNLILKLQKYEDLHGQCGPNTKQYKAAMKELQTVSGPSNYRNQANLSTPCKYVVWTPTNGLGNRMLSLVSAFLYGLLTDRVLLVDFSKAAMARLFCEPFPNSTWLLTEDIRKVIHGGNNGEINERIITLQNLVESSSTLHENLGPLAVQINLRRRGEDNLQIFHCDHNQELLRRVPVLIIKSDQYYVSSLFVTPSFQKELSNLFSKKDAVFNLLGNYLFQPSNEAWERITTFYQAYLSQADQRVGIQIRVFQPQKTPSETIINEVLSCTWANNLLPKVQTNISTTGKSRRSLLSTTILAVSLYSIYGDHLRKIYESSSIDTGQVIGVFQPSNEGRQKKNDQEHDIKAWVEIYLLSLCDVLVTSYASTFGYVAQSLGGLKPWILEPVEDENIANPPCRQALSMEPCSHYSLELGCGANTSTKVTDLFPYIRPCDAFMRGVKLVSSIY